MISNFVRIAVVLPSSAHMNIYPSLFTCTYTVAQLYTPTTTKWVLLFSPQKSRLHQLQAVDSAAHSSRPSSLPPNTLLAEAHLLSGVSLLQLCEGRTTDPDRGDSGGGGGGRYGGEEEEGAAAVGSIIL